MSRLDKELLKRIHNGRCIMMIGSGASIDSGYPSWKELANSIVEENSCQFDDKETAQISQLVERGKTDDLLVVFDIIESKIGKEKLVAQVESIFEHVNPNHSEIYSIITKWPISVFLTTNYDSELRKYLTKNGVVFLEKGNTEKDFRSLSASTNGCIFKIHGDFSNYKSFILSKRDYINVQQSLEYDYWRKKIQSVLMVCDLVIVGYSAKDPDFKDQLEIAKKYSDPDKPIFMFTTDLSDSEIQTLRSEYNIKVIPYNNSSGDHSELRQLLKNYDRFIPKRNSNLVNKTEEQLIDSEIASSMFLLSEAFANDSLVVKALLNSILHVVFDKERITLSELYEELQTRKIYSEFVSISSAVDKLCEDGYISTIQENDCFQITQKGKTTIEKAENDFSDYRERFQQYCMQYLESKNIQKNSIEKIITYLDQGLVLLFEKRGLEIAKILFTNDEKVDIAATFDVADCLSAFEKTLEKGEYDYYIDLLFSVLEKPSKEVRDYLAIISNGYFAYHFLGHSEDARQRRLNIISSDRIYLDSSILIPLLANSCQNNKYANDLIARIKKVNKNLCVTQKLLQEVSEHAKWAIRNCSNKSVFDWDSYYNIISPLDSVVKENLFFTGAINWATKEGYTKFDSYFKYLFGEEYRENIEAIIEQKVRDYGIDIKNASDYDQYKSSDERLLESYKEQIIIDRQRKNSFRSEFQCETEAELLVISSFSPFSFLTHTTNLKRFDKNNRISHWFPEGVYRFLQMNDESIDLDNLFNCMISGLYSSGIRVFNKEDLERITRPYIHQAELRVDEMAIEEKYSAQKYLSKEKINQEKEDLTLPFYTSQLESFLRKKLEEEKDRASKEISRLELIKKEAFLSKEERTDYERLKNKKKQKAKKMQNKRKRKR